jgi:formylglycine-generating enzyme
MKSPGMIRIPGGTFRMGSDRHYPEEAPAHIVTVSAFWMDRYPVTNREFKEFAKATRHVTVAEVPPDPKHYPGAQAHMIYAVSLVFTPPICPVDMRCWGEWWALLKGANWRHPYGPKSNIHGLDDHPVVHVAYSDALAYATWAGKNCRRSRNGNLPRGAGWKTRNMLGPMTSRRAESTWPIPGRANSRVRTRQKMAMSVRRP